MKITKVANAQGISLETNKDLYDELTDVVNINAKTLTFLDSDVNSMHDLHRVMLANTETLSQRLYLVEGCLANMSGNTNVSFTSVKEAQQRLIDTVNKISSETLTITTKLNTNTQNIALRLSNVEKGQTILQGNLHSINNSTAAALEGLDTSVTNLNVGFSQVVTPGLIETHQDIAQIMSKVTEVQDLANKAETHAVSAYELTESLEMKLTKLITSVTSTVDDLASRQQDVESRIIQMSEINSHSPLSKLPDTTNTNTLVELYKLIDGIRQDNYNRDLAIEETRKTVEELVSKPEASSSSSSSKNVDAFENRLSKVESEIRGIAFTAPRDAMLETAAMIANAAYRDGVDDEVTTEAIAIAKLHPISYNNLLTDVIKASDTLDKPNITTLAYDQGKEDVHNLKEIKQEVMDILNTNLKNINNKLQETKEVKKGWGIF
jgi:hypothetical protein